MQYKTNYFSDAVEKLKNLGIKYDCVRRMIIDQQRNYGSETDKISSDIHLYFMAGNTDVAYFTLCTQSLMVHDKPRIWGASALERLTAC